MNEKDFIYSKDISLEGEVKWTAPSNIAIVKYWGKLENQIPQNPSISFTLNKSITNTSLSLKPKNDKTSVLTFEFEGKKNILRYTTISGVEGFDGSKKEAKRTKTNKIN